MPYQPSRSGKRSGRMYFTGRKTRRATSAAESVATRTANAIASLTANDEGLRACIGSRAENLRPRSRSDAYSVRHGITENRQHHRIRRARVDADVRAKPEERR